MDSERKARYEQLYNIKLTEFYNFVSEVMGDFNYSLHRTVKDIENKRRIEIWAYQSREDQAAVVWIEVVKPGEILDPYITTDVLRTMNDENVTRLFFFTNGQMGPEEKDVLEGSNHFVFGTDEIVETLIAIDMKRSKIKLKTSAVPELASQYYKLIRRVLNEIDRIPDINDIPPQSRERLKKIQYDLLPELLKTPYYTFTYQFVYLRNALFSLIEYTIIYIGNVIEYEAEDDLKKNREVIEEIMSKLDNVDEEIANYKSDLMFTSEKIALKLIMYAAVFSVAAVFIMIVLKFTR